MKKENFECIKEDNSEEEQKRQWENSEIIFTEFASYLDKKGYKDSLIERQVMNCSYFVMDYYFVYGDDYTVLSANDHIIRKFLGNWYIRKNWSPNLKEMKEILSAIYDFFEFIYENGFFTKDQFEDIKQVCKDKDWFEKRLKTYKTADGEKFRKWIEEYNYDW